MVVDSIPASSCGCRSTKVGASGTRPTSSKISVNSIPLVWVDDTSGWSDRGVGDVNDMHKYPGPGSPDPEEKRAVVLGEFGGLGLPVHGHTWQSEKNWGLPQLYQCRGTDNRLRRFDNQTLPTHRGERIIRRGLYTNHGRRNRSQRPDDLRPRNCENGFEENCRNQSRRISEPIEMNSADH